jgi:hypothetical protein
MIHVGTLIGKCGLGLFCASATTVIDMLYRNLLAGFWFRMHCNRHGGLVDLIDPKNLLNLNMLWH